MKNKSLLLALLALIHLTVLAPSHCYGQLKNSRTEGNKGPDFTAYYFLTWDANVPLSHTDFVNSTSFLGARLGHRKKLNKLNRLWVGWELSWAVYRQHFPYASYQISPLTSFPVGSPPFFSANQIIAAEFFNYSYNYGLTGNVDYFFAPMKKRIVPYGSFGVGIAYDKFAQYISISNCSWKSYGLLLKPEVGVLVGLKENAPWRIKAALHYDYASNYGISSDQYNFIPSNSNNYNGEYRGIANMGLQVGIVKMMR